jgi:hypothetical protein
MYTTVNQFIAERMNTSGKRVNENILDGVDGDATAQPIDADVQPGAQPEEGSEELTFDAFKDAYMAKYNDYTAELEEGQEAEPVLSDAQLEMIFDVMNSLEGSEDTEAQPEEGDDNGMGAQPGVEEMDATALEEGLGSFLKGGTKEEIAAKKTAFDARIQEIESKFSGKTLLFKEHGDNQTVPYSAAVANKVAAKNNYLGTLSTFTQGDKVIVMYKEGAKGMNKLAAGTTSQTAGA